MTSREHLNAAIGELRRAAEKTEDPDVESDLRDILNRCYRLDKAIRRREGSEL